MEQVSFSVPRNRKEHFQDDIFPDTLDTESFVSDADSWCTDFSVLNELKMVSLCPSGMTNVTSAPSLYPTGLKKEKKAFERPITEEDRKQRMFGEMLNVAMSDDKKHWEEQVEGVSDSEWD